MGRLVSSDCNLSDDQRQQGSRCRGFECRLCAAVFGKRRTKKCHNEGCEELIDDQFVSCGMSCDHRTIERAKSAELTKLRAQLAAVTKERDEARATCDLQIVQMGEFSERAQRDIDHWKSERDKLIKERDKARDLASDAMKFLMERDTLKSERDKLARAVDLAVRTLGLVRAGCIFPGSVIDQAIAEINSIINAPAAGAEQGEGNNNA